MKSKYTIITEHDYIDDLLESVIRRANTTSVTLLICCSREEFLDQLESTIRSNHRRVQTPTSEQDLDPDNENIDDDDNNNEHESNTTPPHPLLTPTLHLLSTTNRISTIFCPNIPTLRAILSTLSLPSSSSPSTLVVNNLLALHHNTSEFTVQGLSRTLSSTISSAHRSGSKVQLIETKDVDDPTNPERGALLWEAQVPLLSGSVRIGGGGAGWAGRAICVRRVVERWFEFET